MLHKVCHGNYIGSNPLHNLQQYPTSFILAEDTQLNQRLCPFVRPLVRGSVMIESKRVKMRAGGRVSDNDSNSDSEQ